MAKSFKELSEETEKLRKENAELRQQLGKSAESIAALKAENIDAMVIANEKALRVYTAKSADKPYRTLIEKMHEGAVTINDDGTIIYCNSYFARLVNLPLQKVIGSAFGNYIADHSKNKIDALIKKGSMQVVKDEVLIYSGKDKIIPVLLTINALSLDNISVLSIIITDLTTQHEDQEKLKLRTRQLEQSLQLNADKDRFLSILAHDLRSPFNSFLGLSELLLENINSISISEVELFISKIHKSAENLFTLLEDLLKWARMISGKELFSPQKLNFSDICNEFFEVFMPIAESKKITIKCFISEEIYLFADINMVKSVFRNIISNAIKFTGTGGQVEISIKQDQSEVTITISDNGIGIELGQLSKMFDISNIYTTQGTVGETGTGLGLLLCKEFIEKHGGKIWVESEPGTGSKFNFTLPLFTGQISE